MGSASSVIKPALDLSVSPENHRRNGVFSKFERWEGDGAGCLAVAARYFQLKQVVVEQAQAQQLPERA